MSQRFSLLLVVFFCLSPLCYGQTQEVEIEVSLVKIDQGIEKPWANAFVKIYPFFGSSLEARADQSGKVRFKFRSSRSVVFRVGDDRLLLTTRLGPLSGRMTQRFSFVSDPQASEHGLMRTMQQTVAYGSSSQEDVEQFAKLSLKHFGIEGIVSDLRFQSGGRLMTEQSRQYLRELRSEVEQQFSVSPNATDDQKLYIDGMRNGLLEDIDSLLEKPWRLGVESVNRFDDLGGVLITGVVPGSAADESGLRSGDLITHVNDQHIATSSIPFRWMIANADTDDNSLTIKSAGSTEIKTASVRLKRD